MLEVLFERLENLNKFSLSVLDLRLAQALDQVADSGSHDFTTFALIQLTVFNRLNEADNPSAHITVDRHVLWQVVLG